MANSAVSPSSSLSKERWTQLIAGMICMIMIANLQYGWTLFVHPIAAKHGWSVAAIQVAFSVFIALETWLTPVEGWLVDKIGPQKGPKLMVAIGGIGIAAGWIVNSYANSLEMLYFGAVLGGIGGGAVYATCVGQAVKWFPDHRGLAVGLTAAGYGAGAALTVVPIREMIATAGYESTFFWFGLGQGAIVFMMAWLLRAPETGELIGLAPPKVAISARSFTPAEVLRSPIFWVLYIMFVMVAASGLMATAQVALIARDYNIANLAIIGGATALSVALIVDNVCNGLARPLFGWVSDNIGREYTMAIAFTLGAASYWLLGSAGGSPWAFVTFAAMIFLTWGEIYSLFPSTCTDSFGPKFATVNLSLLYTAKGASAFLVPVANMIKSSTGSWHMVFVITAIMNLVVVALALFVLKPMRARASAQESGNLAHAV
ncbi:MAG TPA: oxalate/formate MFS antiporter [Pseudolabrys sp.]|jgi:MFS transporter, OFA family, oxalate/formate antiporter|uniref:oxalate/formate MFS antiporter n=1 Tax=Pseudolabrys sp. TaxID=1960880 RepID=UPI002DDD7343|nr:oxalate/formate MFS antiporter [Pseudolabrys sp.]HEV2630062.1 oxalate/formate MFS antiporter [Pseudolabrys sp.]